MMKKRARAHRKCSKTLSAILCIALVSGLPGVLAAAVPAAVEGDPAYKDTLDQIAADEAKIEIFTLTQVRELSRAYGSESREARADLAVAQAGKDAAEMRFYSARSDVMAYGTSAVEKEFADAISTVEGALIRLDDAKASLETQTEVAIYKGEDLFFAYLQLLDSLALLDKSIALSREQIRIEELKATIGLSTRIEVQKKALALEELADRRQNLLRAMDATGRNLMQQMGKDPDTPFRLDPGFSIEGLQEEYEADQLADLTVKNNLNLGVLNRFIDKQIDSIVDGMSATARFQIGADTDKRILERDNLIQGMRLLARNTATGLVTARAEISLLEKKAEEKDDAYTLMILHVDLGLAPRIGLAVAELELATAQNDLLKAQQNYYLSLRMAELLVKGVAITSGSS